MKFYILALTVAIAYSSTIASTSLSYTATYNAGTKLNATCSLATSFTATYASLVTGSEFLGLWLASTSAVTTTSTSDMMVFVPWTATSTGGAVLSTTFVTAPMASAYSSSGTAWTLNSSLTTNTTSITAGATAGIYITAFTFVLPLAFINFTTSNFTKSSLSWNYWAVITTSAVTYNSASWTGSALGATTIGLSACTTGMAAITSGSSLVSSVLSSFLALSFF